MQNFIWSKGSPDLYMPDVYFISTPGVPLVMVVLSLVIASSQDGGVDTYVHGDL